MKLILPIILLAAAQSAAAMRDMATPCYMH